MSTASSQGITPSAKYKECTGLISQQAERALRYADDWLLRDNTPSAQHCRALSLFSLKRFRDAAGELERLSTKISQENRSLWSNVMRQASQAWLQSDQLHRAIASLTRAILVTERDAYENSSMQQLTIDMLMERSALHLRDGETMDAIQDLDNAVALRPNDTKLRLARAKLFIAMKETALAQDDLKRILAMSPNNAEAKKLLGSL